jgi:hypothetical protein
MADLKTESSQLRKINQIKKTIISNFLDEMSQNIARYAAQIGGSSSIDTTFMKSMNPSDPKI